MLKKILIIILIAIFPYKVFAQQWVSDPVRLTTGNNDRNPSFGNHGLQNSFTIYNWEFLSFERVTDKNSNIFVIRVRDSSSISGEYNISNSNDINKNPSIAYNQPVYSWPGDKIKYAVIAWQSDKFDRQSIFISSYKENLGWSIPIILDSSNTDNVLPKVCCLDSINFSIIYQSGNDIKYKRYNINTNIFSHDANVTNSDPNACSNPEIKLFQEFPNTKICISYEREISSVQRGIYFTSFFRDSIPVQAGNTDTIAFIGINKNRGFGNDHLGHCGIFESSRNGSYKKIYTTSFQIRTQSVMIENSNFDCINYSGSDFPITDARGENAIHTYNLVNNNGISIDCRLLSHSYIHKISINPDYQTATSINKGIGIPNTPHQQYWLVYNKDSLDPSYPSTIYGVFFTNFIAGVNSNSLLISDKYTLIQNFPNPFNPTTHIHFSIPKSSFVTLKIYDITGKEVAMLVNENMNAGVHSYDFNGEGFASGVYFYKFTAGDFTDIKKMTFLK